ncbi:MAG: hypothetical protein IT434_14560 [Phycisphaerales bacterium]|nr:hypothetical protein [Phycisphaerales bacterium]
MRVLAPLTLCASMTAAGFGAGAALAWPADGLSKPAAPATHVLTRALTPVRVTAVRVSDDDGRRQTPVSPDEVSRWLQFADLVYKPAGMRFVFDPEKDFHDLKSTRINNTMPAGVDKRADLTDVSLDMRRIAAGYPKTLVVFFRWGNASTPTGNSFSSGDLNYVVGCGFASTGVCGHQNISLLAHEMGHYVGLAHTFAGSYQTVADAAAALLAANNNPLIFAGDPFDDTPPDPMISEIACLDTRAVRLGERDVPICRDNIMSYYDSPTKTLSPRQVRTVKWMLERRSRFDMTAPQNTPGRIDPPRPEAPREGAQDAGGAGPASGPAGPPGADAKSGSIIAEFETLPIAEATRVNASPQDMLGFSWYGFSQHAQLYCRAEKNATLAFKLDVPREGWYDVIVYATLAPDYGQVQAMIAGRRVGQPFDLWADSIVLPSGPISLGRQRLTKGTHEVSFTVIAKHPLASAFNFGLDAIELRPDGPAR